MSSSPKRHTVLVVDDDPDFNKLLRQFLSKLGFSAEIFSEPGGFLARLKGITPSLCVIDLNLGEPELGFDLIRQIRATYGSAIPLFIASGTRDSRAIAHAVELGANDYLLKPVSRDILIAKLRNYLSSEELNEASWSDPQPGDSPFNVYAELELEILEVDEIGVKIRSRHLVGKGTPVYLSGGLAEQFTGSTKPKLLTVTSTWIDQEPGLYGAYLEFDLNDVQLVQSVRTWIQQKSSKLSPSG